VAHYAGILREASLNDIILTAADNCRTAKRELLERDAAYNQQRSDEAALAVRAAMLHLEQAKAVLRQATRA
jgi:hypothetical protein